MSYGKPRNHGCRISDQWVYAGMRTLILENELLRVVILVDKGSDIVEFRYKPLDLDFLFSTPGGIHNPLRQTAPSSSGSPFLDTYGGGWNEILPNGGPGVQYKGVDLGEHGEISLIPWEYTILEDTPQRISVRLWVRPLRTPFFLEKTMHMDANRPVLMIEERLTNEGGEDMHCMWGHHIAFGRPFLDEGAVIDTPARRVMAHESMPGYEPRRFQPGAEGRWPQITAPGGSMVDASLVPAHGSAQAQEMAYLADLEGGWYAITNPARQVGFGLRFDPHLFRYIWYWQLLGEAAQGYPWWGRTQVTALEPWTSYPTNGLNEAVANGSALCLSPGSVIETRLCAIAYTGLDRVKEVTGDGQVKG